MLFCDNSSKKDIPAPQNQSSPGSSEHETFKHLLKEWQNKNFVRSGIWTHAHIRGPEYSTAALPSKGC